MYQQSLPFYLLFEPNISYKPFWGICAPYTVL
uniref:Uncharacterized protein n=1 Tax=Siphoviridae sp. ctxvK3 TaxID=2827975 RepID=A0A8S5SH97_9CAUD|nr:MAG TPA: hypothetical protein [Siphoviridae sp. ctxvK3]